MLWTFGDRDQVSGVRRQAESERVRLPLSLLLTFIVPGIWPVQGAFAVFPRSRGETWHLQNHVGHTPSQGAEIVSESPTTRALMSGARDRLW
jgi:hypothetical protein